MGDIGAALPGSLGRFWPAGPWFSSPGVAAGTQQPRRARRCATARFAISHARPKDRTELPGPIRWRVILVKTAHVNCWPELPVWPIFSPSSSTREARHTGHARPTLWNWLPLAVIRYRHLFSPSPARVLGAPCLTDLGELPFPRPLTSSRPDRRLGLESTRPRRPPAPLPASRPRFPQYRQAVFPNPHPPYRLVRRGHQPPAARELPTHRSHGGLQGQP